MASVLALLAAVLFAQAAAAQAQAQPIVWQDGFRDIRVGRVGDVLWVYWYGVDNFHTYVRKRVIDLQGVTAEQEANAVAWVQGKPASAPTAAPYSVTIWNSERVAAAKQAMDAAIAAEMASGNYPKPDFSPPPDPPPPPPPATFVVTGAQAFPLKPDGTRSFTPWPSAPVAGEACDCSGSNRLISFGATFCKVPRLSVTQTIVAGCTQKR